MARRPSRRASWHPVIRPVAAAISQTFGENPTKNLPWNSWLIQTFGNYQPDGHSGEDYACDVGTPVRAVTSGTVLHIGWMGGTYADNPWWIAPNFAGYCAVIDHGAFIGIYGHCQDGSAKVRKGDRVAEGQVFILSGNTGGSTGPHLHFEILPDGYILQSAFYGRIDPEPLFIGSLSYAGTTTTPLEDEDDVSAEDVWTHNIEDPNEPGRFFPAYEWVRRANVKAGNAEALAGAALQAITGLLQTQLPDPNGEGRTYSLAEWIVYANVKAGGAQQAASQLSPEVIAEAVAKATSGGDAKAIAERLQIIVKES